MNGASSCGALLEHIQQEHHRLNNELIAIGHDLTKLAEGSHGPVPAELVERLRWLDSELAIHFRDEESGGCLEEAATRAPSVSHQVRQIEAEHRDLLLELERIITAAANPIGSRIRVARDFADFAAKIHAHEAAETQLMEYAFGGEASDYDIEGNE